MNRAVSKVISLGVDSMGEAQAKTCAREDRMDFDQAITAHSSWKSKLRSYLNKPDHSLVPADVAQDNKCELGKWINGEGAKHANMPEFQTLRTEHTHFHKAAAEVVKHADAGKNTSEEIALGGKSEFSTASSAVVNAIMAMKSKIAHH